MIIRQETQADNKAVYNLVKTAFETAEHSDGTEQDLVERLRQSAAFVPQLSLVALEGTQIVGHILFTEIGLGSTRSLALAPLAVHPAFQKHGVGRRLIEEGHRIAGDMGYDFSVLVGIPSYYPRMGYLPASRFGIRSSIDVPAECFMAIDLTGQNRRVDAAVTYADEFMV